MRLPKTFKALRVALIEVSMFRMMVPVVGSGRDAICIRIPLGFFCIDFNTFIFYIFFEK